MRGEPCPKAVSEWFAGWRDEGGADAEAKAREAFSSEHVAERLWDLALHEAGHAVARSHFGETVEHATIVRSPHVLTQHRPLYLEQRWQLRRIARQEAVVAWAGVAAQYRHVTDPDAYDEDSDFEFDVMESAADDMARLEELLTRHCAGASKGVVADHIDCLYFGAARSLVRRRWRQIEAVATDLYQRGTLTGEEVQRVCEAVME